MAKQKQKGGYTSAEIATNRQPTGKRARSREVRSTAEAASQLKAALRRKAKGTQFLTAQDHTILGDRAHR